MPAWFDHPEESFSHKEVQFKMFCPPVKTCLPPAENINETLFLYESKLPSLLPFCLFR